MSEQCDENGVNVVSTKLCEVPQEKNKEDMEKCREWLENCCVSDELSICESNHTSNDNETYECESTTTDCSSDYSQLVSYSDKWQSADTNLTTVCTEKLQTIIGQNQNVYENILINNSKKVHLGNVTVINGPIYIKEDKRKKTSSSNDNINDEKVPEHLSAGIANIRWIDRRAWLSQPPMDEYDKLKNPAKFVIICHSATEDATNHADNILLVRYIQQFHIECRKWTDIAYNFLIGCDGYTYKGRGWGIVGAHSFRYNPISVGICFVGTFCTKMPPKIALDQAKALIKYGVDQGEIDSEYSLIGNCQASSSKSPGEMLFEEIKTWPHFDTTIDLEHPSPLIRQ